MAIFFIIFNLGTKKRINMLKYPAIPYFGEKINLKAPAHMNHRAKRNPIKLLLILVIILVIAGLSCFCSRNWVIKFLSPTQSVNADYLIIEGWVGESVLKKAVDEFNTGKYNCVFTTGSKIESFYMMPTEGLLEYQFIEKPFCLQPGDSLELCVKGTPVQGIYPKFSVFLNDQKISQQYSTENWDYYSFTFDSTKLIRNLGISFDNDKVLSEQDRNLYVKSIIINGISLPARSKYSFYFDKSDYLKKYPYSTNYHSFAALCAADLKQKGIPEDKIIIVDSPLSNHNRTFISALTLNNWFIENGFSNVSINIITEDIHGLRTHLLFKYALKNNCEKIGIISVLPDNIQRSKNKISNNDILKELTGILYYKFLFDKRKFKKVFIRNNAS